MAGLEETEHPKRLVASLDMDNSMDMHRALRAIRGNPHLGGYIIRTALAEKYGLDLIVSSYFRRDPSTRLIYSLTPPRTLDDRTGEARQRLMNDLIGYQRMGINRVIVPFSADERVLLQWLSAVREARMTALVGQLDPLGLVDAHGQEQAAQLAKFNVALNLAADRRIGGLVIPADCMDRMTQVKNTLRNIEPPVIYSTGFMEKDGRLSPHTEGLKGHFRVVVNASSLTARRLVRLTTQLEQPVLV